MLRHNAIYILTIFLLIATGCVKKPVVVNQPIATVSGKFLYKSDLDLIIPKDISEADSALMAEDYIKKWITKELLINKAEENLLAGQMDVSKELEDYRNSLIIYKYKKELIRQKMDTTVRIDEVENYYNNHSANFLLPEDIVKAIYIKIPTEIAKPEQIKMICKNNSEEDIAVLKEYCLRYAKTFDMFDGKWIEFNKILKYIPIEIDDHHRFLTKNRFLEINDDTYFYFLCINDFRFSSEPAPVDYVTSQIKNLILNKRKIEFLKNIENEIYEDGIRTNKFRIYN